MFLKQIIVSVVELWLLMNSYQHFLFTIVFLYGLKIDLSLVRKQRVHCLSVLVMMLQTQTEVALQCRQKKCLHQFGKKKLYMKNRSVHFACCSHQKPRITKSLSLYDPIYFIVATESGTFLLSSKLNNT